MEEQYINNRLYTPNAEGHSMDIYYRIGSQVHDHEARIRLLERDNITISENIKQLNSTVEEMRDSSRVAQERTETKLDKTDQKLDHIEGRISEHILQDNTSLRRLFASSILQFLVVASGIIYIIIESKIAG